MEHPTVTFLRAIRRIAISLAEFYGCDADPNVTWLVTELNQRIPPESITIEEELRGAADLYRTSAAVGRVS